jgi:uncharacterized membrane protein
MKIKFIQFPALMLLLLVTGLFWGTWFALSRSIQEFTSAEFIHIGKVIIKNVANPMKIIMPTCILLMIASLWFYPMKRSPGFYFNIAAVVLIVITLFITLLVEVPIDNHIKTWSASSLPKDWEQIRDKWQRFHTVRTITSIMSFAAFLRSALFMSLK